VLKKKIAVFTSIRSEYGLLSPLIKILNDCSTFELHLLVGGAHLLDEFGMTINQIKNDGFPITGVFDFLTREKREDAITQSLSTLQKQIGEYLLKENPELMILMGDRFELMPVATACLLYNIPVAHISGGEITEGAQDNQVRHALTKLSHLHFPATEEYAENIIKMGEEKWRICVSGEPGLDLLKTIHYIPKKDLYRELGLDEKQELIICTFHPETISNKISPEFVKEVLEATVSKTHYQVLVTAANFDHGGTAINKALEALSSKYKNIVYVKSLGQLRYYSVLKCAKLMLGNSSSGILEAQSFNLPVVNVGNRQEGRTVNPSVHQVKIDVEDVMSGIEHVTSDSFKQQYFDKPNIFGDGKACERIMKFLEQVNFSDLIYKRTVFSA
jgi:GDP/UDP-N,N'-diacetylbacillosamine 2-epimerase (hydrolysing)